MSYRQTAWWEENFEFRQTWRPDEALPALSSASLHRAYTPRCAWHSLVRGVPCQPPAEGGQGCCELCGCLLGLVRTCVACLGTPQPPSSPPQGCPQKGLFHRPQACPGPRPASCVGRAGPGTRGRSPGREAVAVAQASLAVYLEQDSLPS